MGDAEMPALELLTSGWGLIEAPRVDAEDNLYFSDVPNGGVHRRQPDGTIDVVIPKRRGVGGMVFHAAGGLVVSGRNIQHVVDGESRVVFDPGVPGFNDLHTDRQGRIYVGSIRQDPFSSERNRVPGELYRINLDGSTVELYGDVMLTNGIGFSPDGSRLYHSDSIPGTIWVSDVDGDEVTGRRAFVEQAATDGLAVDVEGGVWVALAEGGRVHRYGPDASLSLEIEIPDRMVTSLVFGGADMKDLYIVTGGTDASLGGCIYRTRAPIAGVPTPLARIQKS